MATQTEFKYALPCVYCSNEISFSSSDEFRRHLISLHSNVIHMNKKALACEQQTSPSDYGDSLPPQCQTKPTQFHNGISQMSSINDSRLLSNTDSDIELERHDKILSQKKLERLTKTLKGKCEDIEELRAKFELQNKQLSCKDEEHHKLKQRWRAEAKEAIQNIRSKYEIVLTENKYLKEQLEKEKLSLNEMQIISSTHHVGDITESNNFGNLSVKSYEADIIMTNVTKIRETTCRVLKLIYDLMSKFRSIKNDNNNAYESILTALDDDSMVKKVYNQAEKVLQILSLLCNQDLTGSENRISNDIFGMEFTEQAIEKEFWSKQIPEKRNLDVSRGNCGNIFHNSNPQLKNFRKKSTKNINYPECKSMKKRKAVMKVLNGSRRRHLCGSDVTYVLKEFDKQNLLLNLLNKTVNIENCKKTQIIETLTNNFDQFRSENSSLTESVNNLKDHVNKKDLLIENYKLESSYLLEKFNKTVEENQKSSENNEKLDKRVGELLKIPEILSNIKTLNENISNMSKTVESQRHKDFNSLQQKLLQEQKEKSKLLERIDFLERQLKDRDDTSKLKLQPDENNLVPFSIGPTERENQLSNLVENLSLEKEVLSSRVLILETIREEVEILREEKTLMKNENIELRRKLESKKSLDSNCSNENSKIALMNILAPEKLSDSSLLGNSKTFSTQSVLDSNIDCVRHDSGCIENLEKIDRNENEEQRFNEKNKDEHFNYSFEIEDLSCKNVTGENSILKQLELLNDSTIDYNKTTSPTRLLSSTFLIDDGSKQDTSLQASFPETDIKNFLKDCEGDVDYDFEGMLRKFENTIDEMYILHPSPDGPNHTQNELCQLDIHNNVSLSPNKDVFKTGQQNIFEDVEFDDREFHHKSILSPQYGSKDLMGRN